MNTYCQFKQDLQKEQTDYRQGIVNNIYRSYCSNVISVDTNNKALSNVYKKMQKKGIDKLLINCNPLWVNKVDEKYYKQDFNNNAYIYIELKSHNKVGWLFDTAKETDTLCFIYNNACIFIDYLELREKVLYYYDYLISTYGEKKNKYNQGSFIPLPVGELDNMNINYDIYYFNEYVS